MGTGADANITTTSRRISVNPTLTSDCRIEQLGLSRIEILISSRKVDWCRLEKLPKSQELVCQIGIVVSVVNHRFYHLVLRRFPPITPIRPDL